MVLGLEVVKMSSIVVDIWLDSSELCTLKWDFHCYILKGDDEWQLAYVVDFLSQRWFQNICGHFLWEAHS